MSRRHISWLLAVTVVACLLVLLLPRQAGKQEVFDEQPLVPGLGEVINGLDQLTVYSAGTEPVQLQRQDSAWVVPSMHGYAADWKTLRNVLAALAQARIVEQKTANPDYFDRLGVAGVDVPESRSVELELSVAGTPQRIIIGDEARDRDGHYVRMASGGPALLIDQSLDVPRQASDWLQREIVDVSADEVVEFTVEFPDGETYTASKTSADDPDFVLQGVPEGREINSAWSVNSIGGALSALNLEAVMPADQVDFSEAVRYRLLTADGLEVEASWLKQDQEYWLRLQASARDHSAANADAAGETISEPPAAGEEPAPDADQASVEAPPAAEEAEPDALSTQQRADEINARVSGWAYQVPNYKYDAAAKRLDSLLKPLPDEGS